MQAREAGLPACECKSCVDQLRLLANPPEDYLVESLRQASQHGLDMETLLGRTALDEFDLAMKADPFSLDMSEFLALKKKHLEHKCSHLSDFVNGGSDGLPSSATQCSHLSATSGSLVPVQRTNSAPSSSSAVVPATSAASGSSSYSAVAAHIGSAVPAIAQAAVMARANRTSLSFEPFGTYMIAMVISTILC